jgi:hypothetical protein
MKMNLVLLLSLLTGANHKALRALVQGIFAIRKNLITSHPLLDKGSHQKTLKFA